MSKLFKRPLDMHPPPPSIVDASKKLGSTADPERNGPAQSQTPRVLPQSQTGNSRLCQGMHAQELRLADFPHVGSQVYGVGMDFGPLVCRTTEEAFGLLGGSTPCQDTL